jgi:hypothetical protein
MAALQLWQFNRVTGLWNQQRAVTPETADAWLAIFKKDQPQEFFLISKNKPYLPPKALDYFPEHRKRGKRKN